MSSTFQAILYVFCVLPAAHSLQHRGGAGALGLGDTLESATDFLLDAKMQTQHMDDLTMEVKSLKLNVAAGGDRAKKALARLIELSNEPNAKWVIENAGVLQDATQLMSKEESSDEIQSLAGSFITRVTDTPVTSETSDDKTGSYGRTHVVIPRPSRVYRPDETVIELMAGVQPSETSAGDYLLAPEVDE